MTSYTTIFKARYCGPDDDAKRAKTAKSLIIGEQDPTFGSFGSFGIGDEGRTDPDDYCAICGNPVDRRGIGWGAWAGRTVHLPCYRQK